MARSEEPRIIAERFGDYLVMTDPVDRRGYVIDNDTKKRYPENFVDSILARGYWELYEGKLTVDEALVGITEV